MKSYSLDLRQKLVQAYERRRGSQHALADLLGGSVSFVEKLRRRHRSPGTVAPKPYAGGQQRRLTAAAEAGLREAVRATPAITLEDLCTHVATTLGSRVSVPTMCRALQRLGLPRKKSRSTRVSGTPRASSRRGLSITP
jgi:transposase